MKEAHLGKRLVKRCLSATHSEEKINCDEMSLSWYLLELSANDMVEVIAFWNLYGRTHGYQLVPTVSNVGGPTVMFQKDIISKL